MDPTSRSGRVLAEGGLERVNVLVVDDQASIRLVAEEVLSEAGYRVRGAGSGSEALALAAANGDRFDVLVTDFGLGDVSGREVAELLRADNPDLSVVYMSGLRPSGEHGDAGRSFAETFLEKPFALQELVDAVEQVLSARRTC